jgi:hypothetical protein
VSIKTQRFPDLSFSYSMTNMQTLMKLLSFLLLYMSVHDEENKQQYSYCCILGRTDYRIRY